MVSLFAAAFNDGREQGNQQVRLAPSGRAAHHVNAATIPCRAVATAIRQPIIMQPRTDIVPRAITAPAFLDAENPHAPHRPTNPGNTFVARIAYARMIANVTISLFGDAIDDADSAFLHHHIMPHSQSGSRRVALNP